MSRLCSLVKLVVFVVVVLVLSLFCSVWMKCMYCDCSLFLCSCLLVNLILVCNCCC